jgi:hypothetical protein
MRYSRDWLIVLLVVSSVSGILMMILLYKYANKKNETQNVLQMHLKIWFRCMITYPPHP